MKIIFCMCHVRPLPTPEEVILVAKPEIILVAKYSGGKTSLKYLITPPAHNQLYMCRGKKKNIFFVF